MDVDPVASMRCWAIQLELAGNLFTIPALPAADWWPVLTTGDLALILDFIEDTGDLDDLILDGRLAPGALGEALTDTVEVTAGRPLHASMLLAAVAGAHWASINGTITARGFRWDVQPLGAALDAIHAEVTGRLEKAELTKFLAMLDNPGPGAGKGRGRKAAQDFETMAGPKPTQGVKSTGGPSDNERPKTRTQHPPPHPTDPLPSPTPRPGPPGRSDQQATTESRAGVASPTSDTGLHPHQPGR